MHWSSSTKEIVATRGETIPWMKRIMTDVIRARNLIVFGDQLRENRNSDKIESINSFVGLVIPPPECCKLSVDFNESFQFPSFKSLEEQEALIHCFNLLQNLEPLSESGVGISPTRLEAMAECKVSCALCRQTSLVIFDLQFSHFYPHSQHHCGLF